MSDQKLDTVARYLHRVARAPRDAEPSDGQLLRRFIEGRDHSAFARLVERHGPMVFGVGRRLLRDRHDVEDVFQATFLVLVRKASSIRKHNSLSSWLHGVAWRTAMKIRRKAACQSNVQPLPEDLPAVDAERATEWAAVQPALDKEISLLPEKYRRPIVLCYLEGKTNEQAARELGCTKGTVSGRLARARILLRRRLVRRGVTLTPSLLAAFLCEQTACAAVPAPLLVGTTNLACRTLGGCLAGAGKATKSISLAEGVMQTMWLNNAKMIFGVVLAVIAAGTGVGVWGLTSAANQPAQVAEGGSAQIAAKPMTDQELLQGTWSAISANFDGKPAPAVAGSLQYSFDDNAVTISRGAKSEHGVFTINTAVFPKQIDIHLAANRTPTRGIYRIVDDRLEVCLEEKPTKRPVAFRSDRKSQYAHVVFQRVGPKKGKRKVGRRAQIRRLKKENDKLRFELQRTRDLLEETTAALNLLRNQVADEKATAAANREKEIRRLLQRAKEERKRLQDLQKADLIRLQQVRQREQEAREAAIRALTVNNLRQIGLAFHNYYDVHKRLPAAAIYDRTGRPLLSWRVALLPYLGQAKLYDEFKLDEPWDGPHNKKLLAKMPKVYAPVRGKTAVGGTYYQVVTGPKTMFDGTRGIQLSQVHDGTSNTLLAAEARKAVPWTKPADLPYKANAPLPNFGGTLSKGFHVLRVDGSTAYLAANPDPVHMRRFITIGDGRQIDFEKLGLPK